MLKGLHSILRNIQGGNSSIIENKMHTEAVCVCVLVLCGPNVPTCIVIRVNSPYGNILLGPHD